MSRKKGLMLSFPECRAPAAVVARAVGLDFAEIDVHRFPDGESRIGLPDTVAEHVFIYRTLDQPNEKLLELVLAAATARELGAVRLALVAPYLCYMRQDKAFHPGEAVSQHIVGNLLAGYFDEVVTVDPHLHRVDRLEDAVPVTNALAIAATDAMSHYLDEHLESPILIGPDEESEQWVAAIAQRNDLEFQVAHKQRFGDSDVKVCLPEACYRGRHVVLVDDMVSTGQTLAATSMELVRYQPASITVMVTHALFVKDALARIRAAGVDQVWSCDSIRHATNRITLANSLAGALLGLLTE
jgi:ribose-phosphate pyrophosphokinase